MLILKEKITKLFKGILIVIFILFNILITKSFSDKHNEVKVGILLGFTGPVEILTPSMADSAELAFNEISDYKSLSNEIRFKLQRADTTCVNIKSAKDTAKKIINEGVTAIIGAACPNVTKEIADKISIPKQILMISPADSSNELIDFQDNGFFYRTTPSKIRGSQVLADITKDRGIKSVAISYSNEEEYKKFAETYSEYLKKKNIKTTIIISHNKNINDYSKHISALTAAGGNALAIISDTNLGGDQIINLMLDTGMFKVFIMPDSMINEKIIEKFKKKNLKKSFGYLQGLSSIGGEKFINLANKSGIDPSSPYTGESYDAAAIIILSNFLKLYSKENTIENNVYSVANKPGVKIYPGEIKKAINIIKEGKAINYEGATGIEFNKSGDTFGSYIEVDFKNGKLKTKKIR